MQTGSADFERQMALEAAQSLPENQFKAWCNAKNTQRIGVAFGHILVVFRWMFDEPHVLEYLRIGKLSIDPREGLIANVYGEDGHEYRISNKPLPMLEGKVFCHIPFITTINSRVREDRTSVGFSLVIKSEGSPFRSQDTEVCILALPTFQAKFPQHKDQRA